MKNSSKICVPSHMNMYPQMETSGGTCTPKQKYEWTCCIIYTFNSVFSCLYTRHHEILVLVTEASREDFEESAQMHSLARSLTARTYKGSRPIFRLTAPLDMYVLKSDFTHICNHKK